MTEHFTGFTKEQWLVGRKTIEVVLYVHGKGGNADHLQSIDTIQGFATKGSVGLTIMEGGEHWFHTDEQMSFLDQWLRNSIIKEQ